MRCRAPWCALFALLAATAISPAQPFVPRSLPDPPPPELERGIQLYDRKDFYGALTETAKVFSVPGVDPVHTQRAEFFMAKGFFQLKQYAAALSWFDRIVKGPGDHPYREPTLKWITAVLERAPNGEARALLEHYSAADLSGLKKFGEAIDVAQYELGHLAATKADPAAKGLLEGVPPTSRYSARARLDLARLAFQHGEVEAGLRSAAFAAGDSSIARDAVREIAISTHRLGIPSRAADTYRQLATSTPTASPFASAELSRLQLEATSTYASLSKLSTDASNAVTFASVCTVGGVDDLKPAATKAIDSAVEAIDRLSTINDDQDVFVAVLKLGAPSDATSLLIRIALSTDSDVRELLAWHLELQHEADALHGASDAFLRSQLAGDALQEIALQQAFVRSQLGHTFRTQLTDLRVHLLEIERFLTATREPIRVSYGQPQDGALFVSIVTCTDALTAAASMDSSPVPIAATPPRGCVGCGASGSDQVGVGIAILWILRRRRRRPQFFST